MDDTLYGTQASQFMKDKFPPQGRMVQKSPTNSSQRQRTNVPLSVALSQAQEEFHGQLVVKNNTDFEDAGVALLLNTITKENPAKKIKDCTELKKPQLQAGLGFLNGISYDTAKDSYKSIKVEQLIEQIIAKYNELSPDFCLSCSTI